MNIATQIAVLREKGFTAEQAEVIAFMRVAVGVLFRDFPDSFVLFGGATLLLFHESMRHSGDLDLLFRTEKPPTAEAIRGSLSTGLTAAAEALNLAPLQFEGGASGDGETTTWVRSRVGQQLFRVDLNRFGSVIESELEEHAVELDEGNTATVKSASRRLLLLQKAECFLLRKVIKTRDAFDVHQLKTLGAELDENLKNHLADALMSDQIEAEDIEKRILQVEEKRCRNELKPILPPDVFEGLAKEGFQSLRDTLRELYADWL